jgi:ADP-ribose pyrophosphatase
MWSSRGAAQPVERRGKGLLLRAPRGHPGPAAETGHLGDNGAMTIPADTTLLATETLLVGRVFTVRRELVRLADGREARLEIVRHPGAAAIVPVAPAADGSLDVLLLRQYRHAVGAWIREIPAGTRSVGEDPRECAARELEEETGFGAGRLESLGAIWPAPGYTDESIALFLAQDLTPGCQNLDADEALGVERVPFAQAVAQALTGEIADAKSVVALLRAAARLGIKP